MRKTYTISRRFSNFGKFWCNNAISWRNIQPYLSPSKQTMFWKRCRKTHWIILMIHLGSFCRLHSEGTTQTAWTILGNYYWSICFCLLRPVKQLETYIQLVYFSRSIKLLDHCFLWYLTICFEFFVWEEL